MGEIVFLFLKSMQGQLINLTDIADVNAVIYANHISDNERSVRLVAFISSATVEISIRTFVFSITFIFGAAAAAILFLFFV